MPHCQFGECHSNSSRPEPGISFHPFPKPWLDLERAKRWAYLCGRGKDFTAESINRNSYLCSKHFDSGQELDWKKNHELEPVSARSTRGVKKRRAVVRKLLPHSNNSADFAPTFQTGKNLKTFAKKSKRNEDQNFSKVSENLELDEQLTSPEMLPVQNLNDTLVLDDGVVSTSFVEEENVSEDFIPFNLEEAEEEVSIDEKEEGKKDQGVQVEADFRPEIKNMKSEIKSLTDQLNKPRKSRISVFYDEISSDSEKFEFYTGMTKEGVLVLKSFLGPATNNLTLWTGEKSGRTWKPKVLAEHQLILFLIRLKQGLGLKDMSYRFGVEYSTLRRLIVTWTQFVYSKFNEIRNEMFAPLSHHYPMPQCFRNSLLNKVRVVLDCTEIMCESSRNYQQQGHLYSNYKSHATVKILIGVAPSGACMFVSEAMEGCISDKEIVQKSGILDLLDNGDVVCADRGFLIEELVAQKGAKLVIPPFLGRRSHFSREETAKTKLIARARIHIERFNEKLKNYKILSGVLPMSLMPQISQIVFIISCLVNFQKPLVEK